MTVRTGRLVGVVASVPVLVATVVVVGQATPGYRQMADTVSRLGSPGQPHAGVARAAFVVYGLLVAAGAGPIGRRLPGRERLLSVLVAGYAASAVVAGLASKDPPGPVHTTASQVHVAATVVGGALVVVAMALVATGATERATRRIGAASAALTALGAVVFRLTWGSSYYGLVERVLLAVGALWVASLALDELRSGVTSDYPFQDGKRRALR